MSEIPKYLKKAQNLDNKLQTAAEKVNTVMNNVFGFFFLAKTNISPCSKKFEVITGIVQHEMVVTDVVCQFIQLYCQRSCLLLSCMIHVKKKL